MVEILSVVTLIGYLWSLKKPMVMEKITQQNIDYLNKIYMLTQLVDYSQGFVFFYNKLIFSSLGQDAIQEYCNCEDVQGFCEKNNMSYDTIMDHYPLKMVRLSMDKNKKVSKDIFFQPHNSLKIILDYSHNIISWVNEDQVFYSPENHRNLDQWWSQLMDQEIVSNNTHQEIITSLKKQNSYLLTTLQEQCFMVEIVHKNHEIIMDFLEVTNSIGTQRDLYNNGQLIQYLIQSIKEPMIVFNKNQMVEFVNGTAQEILSDLHYMEEKNHLSLQQLGHLFSHCKKENLLTVNGNNYQLKTKIIGNFLCWILIKKCSVITDSIVNPSDSCTTDTGLEHHLQVYKNHHMAQESHQKISMGLIHNVEKYYFYQNINEQHRCFNFIDLIDHWTHQWRHEKKITVGSIKESPMPLYIQGHDYFLKNFFSWIVGEIINWSCLNIQFKMEKSHCYIIFNVLSFPSRWLPYQQEFLDYLQKSYGPMIKKNGGFFHCSLNNWRSVIHIGFKSQGSMVVAMDPGIIHQYPTINEAMSQ
jgi:hypothetical protein